jgi:hypothetical protein
MVNLRGDAMKTSIENVLPRTSFVLANDIKVRVFKYSTRLATKTEVRRELDHISFHLQNWLGGTISANAACVSPQLANTGLTASRIEGTERKFNINI